ncbi:MAG: hypothetical protein M5U14_00960 [Acidimicrobiia bacterium]|nr:hypothetical protein [Acidimicrobiia bacterium]
MRDQAFGFRAATAAKRAHSSATCCWCSSTVRPARALSAVSKSGYTSVGARARCAVSPSEVPGRSSPSTRGHGGSSAVVQGSHTDGSLRARHRV